MHETWDFNTRVMYLSNGEDRIYVGHIGFAERIANDDKICDEVRLL